MPDHCPTPPVNIPSRSDTPITPDNEEEGPNVHISPSFDYHEERRLHLKDEIWLSHHLPRLPPAAVAEASGSPRSTSPVVETARHTHRPKSLSTSTTGTTFDAAPSAFHPIAPGTHVQGTGAGRDLGHHMNLRAGGSGMWMPDEESDPRFQHVKAAQAFPGSSIISPSGPDDGDLDPGPVFIHRQELDSQERLDLEEEAMERATAQREAAGIAGINLGSAAVPSAPSAQTQAAQQPGKSRLLSIVFFIPPSWRIIPRTRDYPLCALSRNKISPRRPISPPFWVFASGLQAVKKRERVSGPSINGYINSLPILLISSYLPCPFPSCLTAFGLETAVHGLDQPVPLHPDPLDPPPPSHLSLPKQPMWTNC